jgi:hypothetical protein
MARLDSEYGDLVYHGGSTVEEVYGLKDEIKQLMEMKGEPVAELSDDQWMCDLAFTVDIYLVMSDLNVKLQGPNQLLSDLLSNV